MEKLQVTEETLFKTISLVTESGIRNVVVKEAIRLADEAELDLVIVDSSSTPMVCKIVNYGKTIYKLKKDKKQPKVLKEKEIHLKYNTGVHDIETKARNCTEFLKKGHTVKIFVSSRGGSFITIAQETLSTLLSKIECKFTIEKEESESYELRSTLLPRG